MTPVLLQPGINNSGAEHWQSRWEAMHPQTVRIQQHDWDHPVCSEWVAEIEACVKVQTTPPVVVAHSLGCLALAKWASQSALRVKALMFVSLPDPSKPVFPAEARGFEEIPLWLGGRRSLIVYSEDDPYGCLDLTRSTAAAWQADTLGIGAKGHINASSGVGDWSFGWQLVGNLSET